MKATQLQDMSIKHLTECFVEIGIAQDQALLADDLTRFNRLFDQMQAIVQELRARDGDQRRALLALYDHPNMQVRLKAVKNTLALSPQAGRAMLEEIANSNHFPQAGEAGMSLTNLDQGVFKPT
jgi:hypothetical protein